MAVPDAGHVHPKRVSLAISHTIHKRDEELRAMVHNPGGIEAKIGSVDGIEQRQNPADWRRLEDTIPRGEMGQSFSYFL